jgi:hypothetical protein
MSWQCDLSGREPASKCHALISNSSTAQKVKIIFSRGKEIPESYSLKA